MPFVFFPHRCYSSCSLSLMPYDIVVTPLVPLILVTSSCCSFTWRLHFQHSPSSHPCHSQNFPLIHPSILFPFLALPAVPKQDFFPSPLFPFLLFLIIHMFPLPIISSIPFFIAHHCFLPCPILPNRSPFNRFVPLSLSDHSCSPAFTSPRFYLPPPSLVYHLLFPHSPEHTYLPPHHKTSHHDDFPCRLRRHGASLSQENQPLNEPRHRRHLRSLHCARRVLHCRQVKTWN